MKNILLIIALLFTFSCESQTIPQQIQMLRYEISKLNQKVDSLQNVNKICCCANKLFWITIENVYWYENQDPEVLNLGDRLPSDDTVCNGAKAVILTEDATIYALYIPEGDGWVVNSSTCVGRTICCICNE